MSEPQNRKSFTYYGKEIPIPEVGDVVVVWFTNFDMRYIEITKVECDSGKCGTIYTGNILKQKDCSVGMYNPSVVKSKDNFEPLLTPEGRVKIIKINPKDKNRIFSIKIVF